MVRDKWCQRISSYGEVDCEIVAMETLCKELSYKFFCEEFITHLSHFILMISKDIFYSVED